MFVCVCVHKHTHTHTHTLTHTHTHTVKFFGLSVFANPKWLCGVLWESEIISGYNSSGQCINWAGFF
jgi:hypothetical protein